MILSVHKPGFSSRFWNGFCTKPTACLDSRLMSIGCVCVHEVQDGAQEGKVSVDGRGVGKHEVYVSPLPASKPEGFERVKGMSCTRDSEAGADTGHKQHQHHKCTGCSKGSAHVLSRLAVHAREKELSCGM